MLVHFHFPFYFFGFHCYDALVIQFWVAGNAMVRLRPPGEGERLCTPWVLLSDLELLGIVAFENFLGFLEVHLSGRCRR